MKARMQNQITIKKKKRRKGGGRLKRIEGEIVTRSYSLSQNHIDRLELFRKEIKKEKKRYVSGSEALRVLIERALN